MDENLKNYKTELLNLLEKSSDNFEKQLNYISAGAIGISMIIVEKVIKDLTGSKCRAMIMLSWIFLTLTLISNLISHIYTFSVHSKTIEEIDQEQYDYDQAKKRNDKIKNWNIASATMLILGIIFFIIYIASNL
jgi:hypothetical protein